MSIRIFYTMDEITLVNLLNKICEKNQNLTWRLKCQYHDGINTSIMKLYLIRVFDQQETSCITFRMETGQVIHGKHRGFLAFRRTTLLVDALLDIMLFEGSKQTISIN